DAGHGDGHRRRPRPPLPHIERHSKMAQSPALVLGHGAMGETGRGESGTHMNPNQYAWVTDNMTFVSPLGLGVTLALGLALLFLPRRRAILPVLALVCYMT